MTDWTGPKQTPAAPPDGGEVRPLVVLAKVIQAWKLLAGLAFAGAVAGILLAVVLPPVFRANAMVLPETTGSAPSSVVSLAQQFGVGIAQNAASPQLYLRILESRSLRDSVLLVQYADPRRPDSGETASLMDILEIEGDSPEERLETARDELGELTSAAVDDETGVISISVSSEYPDLAAAVVNRQVDLLNVFNLQTRRTQARERREFVEDRLATARAELGAAEDALQRFLQANRMFESSSELRFRHDQLQRDLNIKQEIVLTLAREYEQARIEEVNDAPVLTVIDRAVPPAEEEGPSLPLYTVGGFILGGLVGLSVLALREYRRGAERTVPEDYSVLQDAWAGLRADIRRILPGGRRPRA